MDFADQAAAVEAEMREAALQQIQAQAGGTFRRSHCEDCGAPIPPARQEAVPGCTRCVLCQEYFEHGWP